MQSSECMPINLCTAVQGKGAASAGSKQHSRGCRGRQHRKHNTAQGPWQAAKRRCLGQGRAQASSRTQVQRAGCANCRQEGQPRLPSMPQASQVYPFHLQAVTDYPHSCIRIVVASLKNLDRSLSAVTSLSVTSVMLVGTYVITVSLEVSPESRLLSWHFSGLPSMDSPYQVLRMP